MGHRESETMSGRLLFKYVLPGKNSLNESEVERFVLVRPEPERNFTFYGAMFLAPVGAFVNLADLILEFAEKCDQPGDLIKAYRDTGSFGASLGQRLADFINNTMEYLPALDRAKRAIVSVLVSMNGHPKVRVSGERMIFNLDHCLISKASETNGKSRIDDLAHHAFTRMCRTMVPAIDPRLRITLQEGPFAVHTIKLEEAN